MGSSPAAAPSIPCPGSLQSSLVRVYIGNDQSFGNLYAPHTQFLRPSHISAPHKLSLNGSRLAPENTCDVPISTSHLSFTALSVTKSFAARLLPRTQFDQWLGQSVDDKLQPWSCLTPPVSTSSNPFDQWLQLSFSHACLVVPSSPCVCHSRFYSTVLSVWH